MTIESPVTLTKNSPIPTVATATSPSGATIQSSTVFGANIAICATVDGRPSLTRIAASWAMSPARPTIAN
eukprot:SAG22_NODE_1667_length_3851_cov_1.673774_2_plen_70_part_00